MKRVFLLCILIFSPPIFAYQTKKIQAADFSHVFSATQQISHSPQLIVFLDIDNTLIRSKLNVGTPWFFYGVIDHAVHQGVAKPIARKKLGAIDGHLHQYIPVELIDQNVTQYIQQMQNKGVRILGLTSRNMNMQSATDKQLKSVGIKLQNNAVTYPNIEQWEYAPHFIQSVIYVDKIKSKKIMAASFLNYLQSIQQMPTEMIFADDQLKYVEQLEAVAHEFQINYLGVHFIAEQQREQSFNMCQAVDEFHHLIDKNKLPFYETEIEKQQYNPCYHASDEQSSIDLSENLA